MATYYGYDKRGPVKSVDWSKISNDLTTMLDKEVQRREGIIKEIDDNTDEFLKTLEDNPQGLHKGINEGLATFSNDVREMALMQEKLLKSGKLPLKEYTLQRQNLIDDTNRIFSVGERLQKEYGDILGGWQRGELQKLTLDQWDGYSQLVDFDTHGLYIDPKSGKVFTAEKNEEGEGFKTGTLNSLETILNGMSQTYVNFNTEEWLKSQSDLIAQFQVYAKDGSLTKDPTIRKNFNTVKNSLVSGVMADEYNTSSILTGDLGGIRDEFGILDPNKTYKYTSNKDEFDKDKTGTLIYKEPQANNSGLLDLTFQDSQLKAVKDYLGNRFDMTLDVVKTPPKPKSGSGSKTKSMLQPSQVVDKINILMSEPSVDNVELAVQVLKENYNTYKSLLPKEKQKTIQKIDRIDENQDGNVDAYSVTFVDAAGNLSEQKVSIKEGTTPEARAEALYSLLNPVKTAEGDWNKALESFNKNDEFVDVSELTIAPFISSAPPKTYEAVKFDVLQPSSKSPTVSAYITGLNSVGRKEKPQAVASALNYALESSGFDRLSLPNVEIQEDEDREVYKVIIDGQEINTISWDSRKVSDIADQLQRTYDLYIKSINPGGGTTANPVLEKDSLGLF